jgi:hypothetical protein
MPSRAQQNLRLRAKRLRRVLSGRVGDGVEELFRAHCETVGQGVAASYFLCREVDDFRRRFGAASLAQQSEQSEGQPEGQGEGTQSQSQSQTQTQTQTQPQPQRPVRSKMHERATEIYDVYFGCPPWTTRATTSRCLGWMTAAPQRRA